MAAEINKPDKLDAIAAELVPTVCRRDKQFLILLHDHDLEECELLHVSKRHAYELGLAVLWKRRMSMEGLLSTYNSAVWRELCQLATASFEVTDRKTKLDALNARKGRAHLPDVDPIHGRMTKQERKLPFAGFIKVYGCDA